VSLVLAELYAGALDDQPRARLYLADAKAAAKNDDSLARRIAAFERDRALKAALAK
jgi:hypothetical protein